MWGLMEKVRTLRWDDHRYYHRCRINQSLHLVSALSFVVAYGLLLVEPAYAALVGWLVGMVTRQSGHIFFEPRGHDAIHNVSYEHKEQIKAGYNMRRKAILLGVWAALPLLLWVSPSLGGLIEPASDWQGWVRDVGLLWLALGVSGVVLRTLQLAWLRSPAWGLAWMLKILTDPFHNIDQYWRSPLWLLRGQRFDPLTDRSHAPAHARAEELAVASKEEAAPRAGR